jgi:N-glycosylase/DNA lyase
VTGLRQLEDAKSRAVRKKWAYVARLCREAAEAASLYEDPARVRQLLLRAARNTAEAERLARSVHVVQAGVEDALVADSAIRISASPTERTPS